MKRNNLIFFILLGFVVTSGFSQREFELKGKIMAATADTLDVSVLNLTRQTGTVVKDTVGDFRITVRKGDALYFSSLQFQPLEVAVTDSILNQDLFLVYLKPLVNTLQEVIITDTGLIGIEKADIKNIPLQPYITSQTIGMPQPTKPLPTTEERRIYTASTGIIEPIINTLNGKIKKLKKIDRYAKLDKIVYKGKDAMVDYYFQEYCGIPKPYIIDFVYFCAEDENYTRYLKDENSFELFEFFQRKAKVYRNIRKDVFVSEKMIHVETSN